MKKPEHQWETRRHRAVRVESVDGDPERSERFELRWREGSRCASALCSPLWLWADTWALEEDPDLRHAMHCWAVARGQRSVSWAPSPGGDAAAPAEAITPGDLGAAPGDPLTLRAKLISLAPSNAELLHALGVFDDVVACEDSSDYPPEVADRVRLGPDLGPDLDRVQALAPDLVLASLTVPGMERVVSGLRARGIPHLVLAPRSFDDVLADVTRVAAALARDTAGRELVARMKGDYEELATSRPTAPAKVFLQWWPRPMFAPGRDCYSNELIALAGGQNVFAELPGASREVSAADVEAAAPEAIFVSWCGVAERKLDPGRVLNDVALSEVPAVQNGRVFQLDEAFSGRPGPRMLEAARRMRNALVECGAIDAPPVAQRYGTATA